MELRVLNYFLTVAREENITHAAELLHITQPTLSRQLMQLEEELGVSLFIRGKRKIILTEAGMLLKRRAEEMITLAEKTELEIGHQTEEISGEITISCGITNASQTLGKMIQKFQKIYPKTTFHIRNGASDFTLENIGNGLVDIGIVLEPVNLEKLNFIRLNKKERWGILMKKDSPLAQKDYVTADDLKELPLINTSRPTTRGYFHDWYGTGYDQLHFCASSELSTTAITLVKNDMGYAIVIEGSVNELIGPDLCFKPLYPELYSHSLYVWKKYQSLNLTLTTFIDFLSKEVKDGHL